MTCPEQAGHRGQLLGQLPTTTPKKMVQWGLVFKGATFQEMLEPPTLAGENHLRATAMLTWGGRTLPPRPCVQRPGQSRPVTRPRPPPRAALLVSLWLTPNSRLPPAQVSGSKMPPRLWHLLRLCCPERLVHAASPASSAPSEGTRGTGARSLQGERRAPSRGRAGESSTWPPPWPPGPWSWAGSSVPALEDERSRQRWARTP